MEPPLCFEVWKSLLRHDCQHKDKLLIFGNLGEPCVEALWEAGIEPSVQPFLKA